MLASNLNLNNSRGACASPLATMRAPLCSHSGVREKSDSVNINYAQCTVYASCLSISVPLCELAERALERLSVLRSGGPATQWRATRVYEREAFTRGAPVLANVADGAWLLPNPQRDNWVRAQSRDSRRAHTAASTAEWTELNALERSSGARELQVFGLTCPGDRMLVQSGRARCSLLLASRAHTDSPDHTRNCMWIALRTSARTGRPARGMNLTYSDSITDEVRYWVIYPHSYTS